MGDVGTKHGRDRGGVPRPRDLALRRSNRDFEGRFAHRVGNISGGLTNNARSVVRAAMS